jgi:hypothetical protein
MHAYRRHRSLTYQLLCSKNVKSCIAAFEYVRRKHYVGHPQTTATLRLRSPEILETVDIGRQGALDHGIPNGPWEWRWSNQRC